MVAVVFYAVLAAYNVASFPYDYGCDTHEQVPLDYVGTFHAKLLDNTTAVTITVDSSDTSYKFCNQDMMSYFLEAFPPTPVKQPIGEEWMSDDQEMFANLFGWTCVGIVGAVVSYLLWKVLVSCFCGGFDVRGEAKDKKFGDLKVKTLYVPQRRIEGRSLPLLLIDSGDFAKEFIGWSDPADPTYEEHNVLYDVKELADKVKSEQSNETKMFGTVKYYLAKKNPPTTEENLPTTED
jgi:hypothetical protein